MMNNFTDYCHLWEADSLSADKKFSHLLWNPKIHFRFHKNLPSGPILGDIQPTFSRHI
jgi:hypothetical protein